MWVLPNAKLELVSPCLFILQVGDADAEGFVKAFQHVYRKLVCTHIIFSTSRLNFMLLNINLTLDHLLFPGFWRAIFNCCSTFCQFVIKFVIISSFDFHTCLCLLTSTKPIFTFSDICFIFFGYVEICYNLIFDRW